MTRVFNFEINSQKRNFQKKIPVHRSDSPFIKITNARWFNSQKCISSLDSGLLGRRRPSADRPSVQLSIWTTDQNLGEDRPCHGQIRTLDQDYNFEVDDWTYFWRWTVHLMNGFGRRTTIINYECLEVYGQMDRPLDGRRLTYGQTNRLFVLR